jgi:hypothetical protein
MTLTRPARRTLFVLALTAPLLVGHAAERPNIWISPYSVQDAVRSGKRPEWKRVWAALGLPSESQVRGSYIASARLDEELGTPTAGIFPIALSGSGEKQILLRLGWPERRFFRYVLFERKGPSWHVAGYVDHDFAQYFEPTHRVAEVGGKRWLVFRVQTGSGSSGYSDATQRWFEMADGRLRESLSVVSDTTQFASPGHYWMRLSASVTGYARSADGETISVQYVARFGLDYGDSRLGTVRKIATYQRRQQGETFQFDAARSEITSRQIERLFRSDSVNFRDFVAFDSENLAAIIKSKRGAAFRWLREMDRQLGGDEEGEPLRALLGGAGH